MNKILPDTDICYICKELALGYHRATGEFVCSLCWSYQVEKLEDIPEIEEVTETVDGII